MAPREQLYRSKNDDGSEQENGKSGGLAVGVSKASMIDSRRAVGGYAENSTDDACLTVTCSG